MANTLKKLLSLAIAVIMVLSLIPAVSAEEVITWNEISNEDEWDAWFGGYNKSKLLTEHGDGQPVYLKLTESFEITSEKLQYIGHNTGSICCKVIIDLGGHTLTYNKAASATAATRFMGVYGSANSHLTMQNGTLINNGEYSGASGGVFFMNKGSIKLENMTIIDNSDNAYDSSGKILSVGGSCSAELNNVTFTVNTANSTGSAGIISSNGTLNMTNCTLNGSETSANVKGGLLSVTGGTTTLIGCKFNGGEAEYGAQLYVGNSFDTKTGKLTATGKVTATDCEFNGGKATFGTVAVSGSATLTMEGGYIANGVSESYTTTDAEGKETTTRAKGGNLWIYNGESSETKSKIAVVTLTNVTIKDGVCDNIGGNLYVSNKNGYAAPQVTLNNCTVSGGEGKNGGSIGMTSAALLTVNGGTITGGKGANGGLIWTYNDTESTNSSVLTLNGVTLSEGTAENGGAVYVQTSGTKAPCTAIITDCVIKDCAATTSGGAVYLTNGPVEESVTINNCTIENCSSKDGGAVALSGNGTVGIYGGSITGCEASNAGGAIWVYNKATANTTGGKLVMEDLTIQNNTAAASGGAIYASNASKCVPAVITGNNVTLDSNKATNASVFGGNVYFAGTAFTDAEGNTHTLQASFTDSTIKNGESESFGGNIGMAGSAQLTLTGCTVENGKTFSGKEEAKGGGGNLYMGNSNAVLTLNDTDFIGGEAALYGGNIRIGGGQVIIDQGSAITGGVAGVNGHTIQMNDNAASNIYLYDGVIEATVIETLAEEGAEEEITPEAIKLNGAGNINLINGTVSGFDANLYTVYGKSYAVENEDGTYTVKHYAVDGATTKTGTCEEAGTVTIECAECARTFVYEEAAAGHAIVIDKAVAPTCTETGKSEGQHCAICAAVLVAQEELAATGHTPAAAVKENEVAHTCTTDGSYDSVVYCEICKAELSRETGVVDPAAHTEQILEGKAPTCTEAGLTEGKVCSVCGETLVAQEEIPAGHTEKVVEGKAPTCTETGLTEGKVCEVCGEVLVAQETIDTLGHTEEVVPGKAATCTEPGLTDGAKCTVCGVPTKTQETIDALGHTEEVVPGKAATCTEPGLTDGAKCTVCGVTTQTQETIEALGHTVEVVPGTAATCTEPGLTEG